MHYMMCIKWYNSWHHVSTSTQLPCCFRHPAPFAFTRCIPRHPINLCLSDDKPSSTSDKKNYFSLTLSQYQLSATRRIVSIRCETKTKQMVLFVRVRCWLFVVKSDSSGREQRVVINIVSDESLKTAQIEVLRLDLTNLKQLKNWIVSDYLFTHTSKFGYFWQVDRGGGCWRERSTATKRRRRTSCPSAKVTSSTSSRRTSAASRAGGCVRFVGRRASHPGTDSKL